jgi:hypothetical protein
MWAKLKQNKTLQVDLGYPWELHDEHDFPFFPELKCIKIEISDYQKWSIGINLGNIYKTPKLIASLEDKYKIVVDYRNLK